MDHDVGALPRTVVVLRAPWSKRCLRWRLPETKGDAKYAIQQSARILLILRLKIGDARPVQNTHF